MRRGLARTVLAAGAAALTCAGAAAPAVAAASAPKPPTRVLVRAQEFDLLLSSLRVDPGSAVIQYYNDGEDPHDLRVQRIGDTDVLPIAELLPGGLGELGLRLRRGSRYAMWCSLPNHRELGMEATLKVRRKRR
jgi:plastocyanin